MGKEFGRKERTVMIARWGEAGGYSHGNIFCTASGKMHWAQLSA